MTTNPRGKSFISYKRERAREVKRLIEAQHERGIPTWQDINDLGAGSMINAIRRMLGDRDTANAILWLTPEVKNSHTIQKDEIPIALSRGAGDDAFFVIPVTAGGLDYQTVTEVIDPRTTIHSISNQNMLHNKHDPATGEDAQRLANAILKQRLQAIVPTLNPGDPLRIGLYCANVPAEGFDLLVNWSHCCENKRVHQGYWKERLIPAALDLKNRLAGYVQDRTISLTGIAPLPIMVMLGSVLSETSGLDIEWVPPQSREQRWSIHTQQSDPGIKTNPLDTTSAGNALAILVDVMRGDAITDFNRSRGELPAFRTIRHITPPADAAEFRIDSPKVAAGFAWRVRETIWQAQRDYSGIESVHLFIAAPAGLAFMIGQLLNPFGNIQLYHHDPGETVPYTPTLSYKPHALDLGLDSGAIKEH
jgi:hypothetical protein